MIASEKSHGIINQCYKVLETSNKTLLDAYSLEELKWARREYQKEKGSKREFASIDKLSEDVIEELGKISDEKKKIKGKWIDKGIAFVLGVIAGLLIAYLKGCLKLGTV